MSTSLLICSLLVSQIPFPLAGPQAEKAVVQLRPTLTLVNNKLIHDELDLDSSQKKRIEAVTYRFLTTMAPEGSKSLIPSAIAPANVPHQVKASIPPRSSPDAAGDRRMISHQEKFTAELEAIFTDSQLRRLREIQRRLCGIHLFMEPSVQAQLLLSSEQRDLASAEYRQLTAQMRVLVRSPLTKQGIETESRRLEIAAVDAVLKSMKSPQQHALESLLGQDITFWNRDLKWAVSSKKVAR